MTDEEIVEMYLSRNPTALNVTAEKYGGFLYAISMNVIPVSYTHLTLPTK